ncbi:MAG: polysaccharide deacetylase family protein [Planctomycetota bacterium]|jgi:polysaccharide deacetylase family protein (PEP-CTERM system associated)
MTSASITNALTFDIEDWFHIVEVDAVSDPDSWPKLPSIVSEYTEWIVETLASAKVRATFFMLGWIAERYPQLVRTIAEDGHELGTHSYWHRKVYDLTPEEFREDLEHSIKIIEDVSGKRVIGFRAPSFSIVPGTEWALDVLREAGLEYDASLFPAPRGHGGYPCVRTPHVFEQTPSGQPIKELPVSVMHVGPVKVPFSGGGYLRLLPPAMIRRGFDCYHKRGWPVVVYLHPRDFCTDCPRVPMPLHRRFKSYVGIKSTEGKLRMLLERYRFDSCAQVLGLDALSRAGPSGAGRTPSRV